MTKTAVSFVTVLVVFDSSERVSTSTAKASGQIASFGLEYQKIRLFSVGYD